MNFWIFVLVLITFALACKLPSEVTENQKSLFTYIGFSLDKTTPNSPTGDESAAGHVFIHNYPMTHDGWVSSLIHINDHEPDLVEKHEVITILILRPEPGGWRIINSIDLEPDDNPISIGGFSTITFDPIPVKTGDVFGHFQDELSPTGPIPLNLDSSSTEGWSVGKAGFAKKDIFPGNLIENNGFSGSRDYYINLMFNPDQ